MLGHGAAHRAHADVVGASPERGRVHGERELSLRRVVEPADGAARQQRGADRRRGVGVRRQRRGPAGSRRRRRPSPAEARSPAGASAGDTSSRPRRSTASLSPRMTRTRVGGRPRPDSRKPSSVAALDEPVVCCDAEREVGKQAGHGLDPTPAIEVRRLRRLGPSSPTSASSRTVGKSASSTTSPGPHVVERRPDLIERRPGQLGPRDPVDARAGAGQPSRLVGLPVDDLVAAVVGRRRPRRCGRERPAPPSTSANGASIWCGTRSPNGPASNALDQLGQLGVGVDAVVGAPGQLVGVENLLLPEARLDPGVEAGAEPRRRRRLAAASAGRDRGRTRRDRRAAARAPSPTGCAAAARRRRRPARDAPPQAAARARRPIGDPIGLSASVELGHRLGRHRAGADRARHRRGGARRRRSISARCASTGHGTLSALGAAGWPCPSRACRSTRRAWRPTPPSRRGRRPGTATARAASCARSTSSTTTRRAGGVAASARRTRAAAPRPPGAASRRRRTRRAPRRRSRSAAAGRRGRRAAGRAARPARSSTSCGVRAIGNFSSAHPDEEDGVPLESLGAVDRQQLDRVGLGRRGDVEARAELVLGRRGRRAGPAASRRRRSPGTPRPP